MKKSITPGSLKGEVFAPGSKSEFQRIALLSIFNKAEEIKISNSSLCDDDLSAIEFLRESGLMVYTLKNNVYIAKGSYKFTKRVNVKESGLLARMLSSILLIDGKDHKIDGIGTLLKRDMRIINDSLRSLDVEFKSNGRLPISVKGKIKAGSYFLDGSQTSQFLSGLLITLSQVEGKSNIHVKDLKSRYYIDLTLDIMKRFGLKIKNLNYENFMISGVQDIKLNQISVEGDWSGSSNMIVAGLIAGDVSIRGLNPDSLQGDRLLTNILDLNDIHFTHDDKFNIKKQEFNGFEYNAEHTPDIIPILTVMALNANSKSVIKGINRLKNKESDRAKVLVKEFKKLGVEINYSDDRFEINPQKVKGGVVYSYSDHRIAMALSIAALNAEGTVTIDGAEAVAKSYPTFFYDLENLGAKISE